MFPVIALQIFDFKTSFIAIKLLLVMILNMHLTSEILSQTDLKVSLILWWLCFKGDIGCPLSTSWFDLGSSCNGLSGRINQHNFYLVKNSSVHSDSFRCISLYMLMSSAHPASLFHGRAKVISKKSLKKKIYIYISGGPLSALTCCVNVRLLSGDKKNIGVNLFSKLGWELGLYYASYDDFHPDILARMYT